MGPKLPSAISESRIVKHPDHSIAPGVYTKHRPTECYHTLLGKPIHRQPQKAQEGKETVRVVTNDCIRQLMIPARKPVDYPGIWNTDEMTRLRNQAQVVTLQDRMAMMEKADQNKRRLAIECEARKEMLRQAQSKFRKGKKLSQVEMTEQKRTTHLLKRALDMRQENEVEVKQANSLILATKVHAIRDAQVAEKELIQREIEEEERRLVKMQEQRNAIAYAEEQEKRAKDKAIRKAFVTEVLQQVKEHEIEHLFAGEKKEEEARMQTRILMQMQQEEEEKAKAKRERQNKMRDDLNNANNQLNHFKLVQQEEDRIADIRVQEFLRKKQERDEAIVEETRRLREAKEKEKDHIRELAERALGLAAAGDEMNARRIQEEVERKWRKSEREAAQKKMENNERLKKDRAEQVMDLRRMQALEIEREKITFNKVIGLQKMLYEKELEERKKRAEMNNKHRRDILKQINEKEKERIMEKQRKFEDGIAAKYEQQTRDQNVREFVVRKVNELREHNVPDHLVGDIKRQLNIKD